MKYLSIVILNFLLLSDSHAKRCLGGILSLQGSVINKKEGFLIAKVSVVNSIERDHRIPFITDNYLEVVVKEEILGKSKDVKFFNLNTYNSKDKLKEYLPVNKELIIYGYKKKVKNSTVMTPLSICGTTFLDYKDSNVIGYITESSYLTPNRLKQKDENSSIEKTSFEELLLPPYNLANQLNAKKYGISQPVEPKNLYRNIKPPNIPKDQTNYYNNPPQKMSYEDFKKLVNKLVKEKSKPKTNSSN